MIYNGFHVFYSRLGEHGLVTNADKNSPGDVNKAEEELFCCRGANKLLFKQIESDIERSIHVLKLFANRSSAQA